MGPDKAAFAEPTRHRNPHGTADAVANTIVLPASSTPYALSIFPAGGDDATTGDLDVDPSAAPLTITGAGVASSQISAAGVDRVLDVHAGASVTVENLTLSGGSAPRGADQPQGTPSTPPAVGGAGGNGGGILNAGVLRLTDVAVQGNAAGDGGTGGEGADQTAQAGAQGGAGGAGGGIYNTGSLILTGVTLSGNIGGAGGTGGQGGQPAQAPAGNSGVTGANGGNGGGTGNGGGIANAGGAVTVSASTLTGNHAGAGGNGGSGGTGGAAGSSGMFDTFGGTGGNGGTGSGGSSGGAIAGAGGIVGVQNTTLTANGTGVGGNGGPGGAGGSSQPVGTGSQGNGGGAGDGSAGGGTYANAAATVTLTNVTITANNVGGPGTPGSGTANGPQRRRGLRRWRVHAQRLRNGGGQQRPGLKPARQLRAHARALADRRTPQCQLRRHQLSRRVHQRGPGPRCAGRQRRPDADNRAGAWKSAARPGARERRRMPSDGPARRHSPRW